MKLLRSIPTYVLRDYKGDDQYKIDRELARRNRKRKKKGSILIVYNTVKLSTGTTVAPVDNVR